jgi:hypothetical protein
VAKETVTVLKADGTIKSKPYPEDLSGWQDLVGGYIQVVDLPEKGVVLVMNEEGKILDLVFNSEANSRYPEFVESGDYLAGDVVVLEGPSRDRWNKDV